MNGVSENKYIAKHGMKIRFILVGVWNTIFGYLVFVLLDTFFTHILSTRYFAYMSAMVLGQIIAVLNAFIFHKFYTFRSQTKGKAMINEFFRFSSTYIFTFVLNLVLLPVFVELLLIPPKIAGACIVILLTIVSYFAHLYYSFKEK